MKSPVRPLYYADIILNNFQVSVLSLEEDGEKEEKKMKKSQFHLYYLSEKRCNIRNSKDDAVLINTIRLDFPGKVLNNLFIIFLFFCILNI